MRTGRGDDRSGGGHSGPARARLGAPGRSGSTPWSWPPCARPRLYLSMPDSINKPGPSAHAAGTERARNVAQGMVLGPVRGWGDARICHHCGDIPDPAHAPGRGRRHQRPPDWPLALRLPGPGIWTCRCACPSLFRKYPGGEARMRRGGNAPCCAAGRLNGAGHRGCARHDAGSRGRPGHRSGPAEGSHRVPRARSALTARPDRRAGRPRR